MGLILSWNCKSMNDLYANVIVNISHEDLDRAFSYKIPEKLKETISPGVRVTIPFGKSNREISGFVLSTTDHSDLDPEKIKSIISVSRDDKLVESKLIALAQWMCTRYGSTMINALKTVLPLKKNVKEAVEKSVVLNVTDEVAASKLDFYKSKHQVARARLLGELIKEKSIDIKIVNGKLNISAATIKLMQEQGVIRVEEKRRYRNPVAEYEQNERIPLNSDQQMIVDDFVNDCKAGLDNTYLIHGITGSGKTEVYMEMIDYVVKCKKQVIVLIPEIALTYQTVMRFYKRFGNRVSTLHSRLSYGEKYDQFERAKKGEISIMIGPRSALFTPFSNLGLVVIDEEHEQSYKSETMPKYHAREVARKLCDLHGAPLVLGSATPSLESYYMCQTGEYKLYTLSKRAVSGAQLAQVEVVDLREEMKNGNKSMFSESLKSAIEDRLLRGEQVMLFLNRRGLSAFVSCRSCGETIKCPHCDVSLSKHGNGKLVCHYCGYEQEDVTICPSCGSSFISGMKAGTESVEKAVKKSFPYATTLRMDYDTTRKKGSYEDILSRFANREADILIGTQMIVKGHDFPYVTLMGILVADMSLNSGDYRAGERCFDLLVQAAGRAGRAGKGGKVIIQTYRPEHYAVRFAATQDYKAFYEEEFGYRNLLGYPPAGHMLGILVETEYEQDGEKYVNSLAEHLKNDIINCCANGAVTLIGPTVGAIKKINDIYRFVIYVKSNDIEKLIQIKDKAEEYKAEDRIKVSFDLDPMNGY